MPDFVNMTCPNCAGHLQIPPDVDRLACIHCGTELVVKRGGGIVILNPVVGSAAKIQPADEPVASDQAPSGPAVPEQVVSQEVASQQVVSEPVVPDRAASGQAASDQTIPRLEGEIAALSQQINDLNIRLQQELASLGTGTQEKEVHPAAGVKAPFYVKWFLGRALWKSLVGGVIGLSLIACLIVYAVVLAEPSSSSSGSKSGSASTKENTTSTTGSLIIACSCFVIYPLALIFLFYAGYATHVYKRKSGSAAPEPSRAQVRQFAAEHEARRAALVRDFRARLAPLEAELDRKKQQLADQRRAGGS